MIKQSKHTQESPIAWDQLLKFCSKDRTRPLLQRPFTACGHTWASDGRRIIVLQDFIHPEAEHLEHSEEKFVQSASEIYQYKILPILKTTDQFFKITDDKIIFNPRKTECSYCEGFGKHFHEECSQCSGTGETDCPHCMQSMDCSDCDGTGEVEGKSTKPCEECGGTGVDLEFDEKALQFGEAAFNPKYFHDCVSLPDVVFAPSQGGTFAFKGPGYVGAVQRMNLDKPCPKVKAIPVESPCPSKF